MTHQRNVEGLRHNAEKKRHEAIERTEEAIRQLIKAHKPINFKSVATAAGVSTTWLYNQTGLKERIEHLRAQQSQKTSEPSKLQLQSENEKLKVELERVQARLDKLVNERQELIQKNKQLRGRNQDLKAQLAGVQLLAKENENLEKENRRLFDRVLQLETSERESRAKGFAKARQEAAKQPDIPNVEF